MVKSGVQVTQEGVAAFKKMKFGNEFDFIVYRVNSDASAVVVTDSPASGTYSSQEFKPETDDVVGADAPDKYKYFFEVLTADNQQGYGIYLFEFTSRDNRPVSMLSLITWMPDNAPVKQRILYSSTKDDLKKQFNIDKGSIQLSDLVDFNYQKLICDKFS